MRNTSFLVAAVLLLVANACGEREMTVGSATPPDAGRAFFPPDQVWSGYVERFKFESGSDRIAITLTSPTSGFAVLGAPPVPGQTMNPDEPYPSGCARPAERGADGMHHHSILSPREIRQCAERIPFTMKNVVLDPDRLRFSIELAEMWRDWCRARKPAVVGSYADGAAAHGCAPPPRPGRSECKAGAIDADCGMLGICLSACFCTDRECFATELWGIEFDLHLDGDKASGGSDLGQIYLRLQ